MPTLHWLTSEDDQPHRTTRTVVLSDIYGSDAPKTTSGKYLTCHMHEEDEEMQTIRSKPVAIFRHIKRVNLLIVAIILLGGCAAWNDRVQYIPIEGLETVRTKHFALIRSQCIKEASASTKIGEGTSSQASSYGGILGAASSASTAEGVSANKQVMANNFVACMGENGYDIRCEVGPYSVRLASGMCGHLVLFPRQLVEETVINPE